MCKFLRCGVVFSPPSSIETLYYDRCMCGVRVSFGVKSNFASPVPATPHAIHSSPSALHASYDRVRRGLSDVTQSTQITRFSYDTAVHGARRSGGVGRARARGTRWRSQKSNKHARWRYYSLTCWRGVPAPYGGALEKWKETG